MNEGEKMVAATLSSLESSLEDHAEELETMKGIRRILDSGGDLRMALLAWMDMAIDAAKTRARDMRAFKANIEEQETALRERLRRERDNDGA